LLIKNCHEYDSLIVHLVGLAGYRFATSFRAMLEASFCAWRLIHEPLLINQKTWFSRHASPNKKLP
jgi:hypothetical protein